MKQKSRQSPEQSQKWEVVINTINEKTQKLELHEQGKKSRIPRPKNPKLG